ncbi:hypothetical protein [Streptomyces sp. H27-S2]|uniref:hypothetical protein n=1 Tax=Streptomyces antarcticus TaxID=2996458 RepID=UPI0022713E66|nr:hypothetical protein [Streptomyces sp. H27-S2]MCY0953397.1 hypothetical protein [Streptomyces sp. H27-S2]
MLTYYEVMVTDYGKLSTAADKWQSMAEEIRKVEDRYRDSVQKVTMGQTWVGVSATTAMTNFAGTRYEYQAAQIQAKATATLLRNAHQQFLELKKQLENARAEAVKAGMKVSEQGVVAYDYDRLTPAERNAARHDPDFATSVRESEASWSEHIKAAVKSVDDADQNLKKDLEAVVKDGYGNKNDASLGTGFNGDAGTVAQADDAEKKARADLSVLEMRDDETLDDYIKRLEREAVTRLTGNPQLAKMVSQVLEGSMTVGAFSAATGTSAWYGYKLFKTLNPPYPHANAPGTWISRGINSRLAVAAPGSLLTKIPPRLVTAITGSDEAAALGSRLVRNGSAYFVPSASEANLLTVAREGGLANAAKAAGALRGLGVVGGVAATGYGIANLATYDVDMIQDKPMKFATDLSGTAFNGSLTALTIAPNPVTLGLTVGTGVVYAGCLAWENREAIGKGLDKAGDWIGDKAGKLGSALNPFD